MASTMHANLNPNPDPNPNPNPNQDLEQRLEGTPWATLLLLFEQQVERPADAARWALQGEGEALRAAGREALGGLTHPVGQLRPPNPNPNPNP